ncbi:protein PRRC2C [Hyalella azteca]|uniref:Protein CASC3 n=1 Tax=Hyalella azteca TaxID=294128 RepID=A0A8B7PAP1_HYAAZ|nr:protein PRRC2C [Hyalella azteca]
MSDRRRRRKPVTEGGSDESSDDSADEVIHNSHSDLGSDAEGANSEYESADEEELAPHVADPNNPDAKLDDDEDRKNPQYIPKRGTFYEHDDRTMPPDEEGNVLRSDLLEDTTAPKCYPGSTLPVVSISLKASADAETSALAGSARSKKSWRGDEGKWSHDKFQEIDQAPKPREELVSVYGYDIRSEEGAPRARRRRRYGRGPNKYTRNWEDLDAYSRPARGGAAVARGGKPMPPHPDRKDQDFPALGEPGDAGTAHRGSKANSESRESGTEVNMNQGGLQQEAHRSPARHKGGSVVYTSQEYRRSRPEDRAAGEEQSTRGRGRGARSSRGRGRGSRSDRGGWKGRYPGGEEAYSQHDSRASDDVRVSGVRGEGNPPAAQHHYQQQPREQGKHQQSPRSAARPRNPEAGVHDSPKHVPRNEQPTTAHPPGRQQYGGHPQQSQPQHSPQTQQQHHQPQQPGYHQPQQPQQQQQQQQAFGRGTQKRYSSQRGVRPGNNVAAVDRNGSVSGSNNSHYTPHPHHNYYYHDNSTTPPPQPALADAGLHHGSGLGVNGGGSGAVIYDGTSSNATAARHAPSVVPVASTQFVASAQFVRDPSAYIGAGALAAPAPVLTRMYTPVSVVGTAPAEIVSPVLGPASVAAAVIAPVVTAVPQAGVVARAPFIAPDAAGLIPCQFNATPQPTPPPQFPAPHPPQFPAYTSYPPPPASEGTQPQEVYRNGVMYYNTQSQQPQRSSTTLQKRPKAAIPIVPPPEDLDGEKKDGSSPHPDDTEQYQYEPDAMGASALQDSLPPSDMNAKATQHRTTVVAADKRGSGHAVPTDFTFEEAENVEVVREVNPSDHCAIQQLQLQQQLQLEQEAVLSGGVQDPINDVIQTTTYERSTDTHAAADEMVIVDHPTGTERCDVSLPVDGSGIVAHTADAAADKTSSVASATSELGSSSAEQTKASSVDESGNLTTEKALSEKTAALSMADVVDTDNAKFEDSVEDLETVPCSKLTETLANEQVSDGKGKETSIS